MSEFWANPEKKNAGPWESRRKNEKNNVGEAAENPEKITKKITALRAENPEKITSKRFFFGKNPEKKTLATTWGHWVETFSKKMRYEHVRALRNSV